MDAALEGFVKTMDQRARKIAAKYVLDQMPERIRQLRNFAVWDLHFGPYSPGDAADQGCPDWPGYGAAVEQVRDWLGESDLPDTILVDIQSMEVVAGGRQRPRRRPPGVRDRQVGGRQALRKRLVRRSRR